MNPDQEDRDFESLLKYLKDNRGSDFTSYKRPSLMRRVRRRMSLVGLDEFDTYQDYLEVHPAEFGSLFNTILINVTSFFRDRPAWDCMADEILPKVLSSRTANATIRVWSAGCASGEEAYSLVMLLAEAMGVEACRRYVKVFATDIDEEALEHARRGVYRAAELERVPAALRDKYFDPTNTSGSYSFNQELRRVVIFGRHDLMNDAPISRLDLLACRNTLIYFNREAQEHIVARFHFALKNSGHLFLGRAEMLLTHAHLFQPEHPKHRIFAKVPPPEPRLRVQAMPEAGEAAEDSPAELSQRLLQATFQRSSAAQLVIDYRGNLALMNEAAGARLGLDRRDLGRPFRDLELSYRPIELRSLIEQARDEHRGILVPNVERTLPGAKTREVLDVEVVPLWGGGGQWLGSAVAFFDAGERDRLRAALEQSQHEIETVHQELESTNEELETSNEELQSTIEELQTTNEELQSSNEEMETMNEELQSANSELQALNEELQERTVELDRANAFLESILVSVDVGVIVVDRTLTVQLWNERAEDLWGLRAGEALGRSLLDLDIGLPVQELEEPVARLLAGKQRLDEDKLVLDATNRRGRPIRCLISRTVRRSIDGTPEGVVLLLEEETGE